MPDVRNSANQTGSFVVSALIILEILCSVLRLQSLQSRAIAYRIWPPISGSVIQNLPSCRLFLARLSTLGTAPHSVEGLPLNHKAGSALVSRYPFRVLILTASSPPLPSNLRPAPSNSRILLSRAPTSDRRPPCVLEFVSF
jgi:hypothetical protein